jgi:hypothetical protein
MFAAGAHVAGQISSEVEQFGLTISQNASLQTTSKLTSMLIQTCVLGQMAKKLGEYNAFKVAVAFKIIG